MTMLKSSSLSYQLNEDKKERCERASGMRPLSQRSWALGVVESVSGLRTLRVRSRLAPAAAAEGAAEDAAACVPPAMPTEVAHFNSELLHKVQKSRASIECHPLFENSHANDPH